MQRKKNYFLILIRFFFFNEIKRANKNVGIENLPNHLLICGKNVDFP